MYNVDSVMTEWVNFRKDEAAVRRERAKARELRAGSWWRNQLAAGLCHYCGGKFAPDKLTMDHIVPVARGGRSNKGNVVPACAACNKTKGVLTPAERILSELEMENGEWRMEN